MQQKSITQFLTQEYKEFALYSIEGRAIPSVIDGFKPTQRKVIHVASNVWKNGSEKAIKVFQLSGKVASDAFYHHGDCLDPETEILLSDGSLIKIYDWFQNYPEKKLQVVAFDEKNNRFCEATGHSPRIGNISKEEIEIEMENGETIKCTPNHPFLTNRGWVNAEDLNEDDEIKSFLNSRNLVR